MRFNKLLATLRNGMVSPRLRGRQDSKESTFSAETFENFIVDKVGGSNKRFGLKNIDQAECNVVFSVPSDDFPTPFVSEYEGRVSTATFISEGSDYNGVSGLPVRKEVSALSNSYIFELAGVEYLFESTNKIKDLSTGLYCNAYEFGGGEFSYYYNDQPEQRLNLDYYSFLYNSSDASSVGAQQFFPRYTLRGNILQGRRVGNRTVCFTTSAGPVFLHKLTTYNTTQTKLIDVFLILPWYVDVRIILNNIGINYTAFSSNVSTMISPISPYLAQYNLVNTDVNLKVKVLGTQAAVPAGVYNAASIATPANNGVGLKRNWYGYVNLELPPLMTLGSTTADIESSTVNAQFFIKVPSSDSLYEIVYFVYQVIHGSFARAIQLTAGMPLTDGEGLGTSKWEISSWGGANGTPEVVDFNNGRLWFAKTKRLSNVYWVSGIHPKSPTDIQLFHIRGLLQDRSNDGTTDKSGFGFPESTSGNTDAYGHWNHSPNMAKINAISARRRVHILTERGECQVSLSNGVYLPSTADPIEVRTNSCLAYDIAKGDGKIFYISEEGIRAISTEDADYESQDSILTASLTGLNLKFRKIVWSEKHSCLFALTENNKLFSIVHHEDTNITAVTELITELNNSELLEGSQANNVYKDWNIRFGDSLPPEQVIKVEYKTEFFDIACGLDVSIIRNKVLTEYLDRILDTENYESKFYTSISNFCLEGLTEQNNDFVKKYTQSEIDSMYPTMGGLLQERHFSHFNNENLGFISSKTKFCDGKFIVGDTYILRFLISVIGLYCTRSEITLRRQDGVTYSWVSKVFMPFSVQTNINTHIRSTTFPLDTAGIRVLTDPFMDGLTTDENYITVFIKPLVGKIITQPIYDGDGGINLSPVGDIHRVDRATVQVDQSGAFKIGSVEDGVEKLVPSEKVVGENYTGTVNVHIPNSPDVESKIIIVSDEDVPLHISGVALRGTSYSGE